MSWPHWHVPVVDKFGTEFGGAPYEYDETVTVGHSALEALVEAGEYWWRGEPFVCYGELDHEFLECNFIDWLDDDWEEECRALWGRND